MLFFFFFFFCFCFLWDCRRVIFMNYGRLGLVYDRVGKQDFPLFRYSRSISPNLLGHCIRFHLSSICNKRAMIC